MIDPLLDRPRFIPGRMLCAVCQFAQLSRRLIQRSRRPAALNDDTRCIVCDRPVHLQPGPPLARIQIGARN